MTMPGLGSWSCMVSSTKCLHSGRVGVIVDRKRLVLTLLEELSQVGATAEQETCGSIEVRTELSKGGNFMVLDKVEFEGAGALLHDLPI